MHLGTGTLVARDEDPNRGTIPMPISARRPSTMSSTIPVEFPQNSVVGPQRQQISELQFDKFPSPQLLCGRCEDVSVDDLKSPCSIVGFSHFP